MPEIIRVRCPVCGLMATPDAFEQEHELRAFRQSFGGSQPVADSHLERRRLGPGRPPKRPKVVGLMRYEDITAMYSLDTIREIIKAKMTKI